MNDTDDGHATRRWTRSSDVRAAREGQSGSPPATVLIRQDLAGVEGPLSQLGYVRSGSKTDIGRCLKQMPHNIRMHPGYRGLLPALSAGR